MAGTDGRLVAGRYLLVDELGAGATGTVWRAWDVRRQGWVAAKVLGVTHSTLLLRFVREQAVRVRHPHVVAPTGWAAEDDLVVLAMDLVRGGSVEDLPRPLSEEYAAVLLDQLLQALHAVHAAGLVHRDVKPANLLLEATGHHRPHLRLADFGVAAALGGPRLTLTPGGVGTPGFMAPEQLAGAAPDPRQDLYAAGMVVRGLVGTPHRLGPLVGALTAADPCDRPISAADALARLRRLAVPAPLRWPEVPDRLPAVSVPVHRALGLAPGRAHARTATAPVAVAIGCFTGSLVLSLTALVRLLGQ